MFIFLRLILLFCLLVNSSNLALSQTANYGKQVAEDSIALVAYIYILNLAAKDNVCKDKKIVTEDYINVIDNEITPILYKMQRKEGLKDDGEIKKMIGTLKGMPQQKNGSQTITEAIYMQKKDEAIKSQNYNQVCTALTVMFQTIIQQKRLSLRNISNFLN